MELDLVKDYWHKTDPYELSGWTMLRKKSGGDYRILLLTDTQLTYFSNSDAPEESFSAIQKSLDLITRDIRAYKPDLLILPGDCVAGGGFFNTAETERLVTFLDRFKIPYAPVMGNHDGEGYFTLKDDNRRELIAKIFERGRYSLFKRGPPNIGGAGNYGINLADENGAVLLSFIMLDNGSSGINGYFSADQADWYEWFVQGLSRVRYGEYSPEAGSVVPSLVFFHVPPPEIDALYEELAARDSGLPGEYFREHPPNAAPDTGMFRRMKALGSTTHIFFGHDHKNILDYEYEGIHFVYGLKTGICAYHDNDRTGTTLVTIKDDLTVTVEFMLNQ
jgi:hypothetical protein